MLINIIVGSALLFAISLLFMWFINPTLREKIEQPKFDFQNKLEAFNDTMKDDAGEHEV